MFFQDVALGRLATHIVIFIVRLPWSRLSYCIIYHLSIKESTVVPLRSKREIESRPKYIFWYLF